MKAKLYRVEVGDSLTISHGWRGYKIWELYIPNSGVVVNDHGGCFICECRAKGEVIDVEIDDEQARIIEARIVSNGEFAEVNNKYFDKVKEKYKDKEKEEISPMIEEATITTTSTQERDKLFVVKLEDEL